MEDLSHNILILSVLWRISLSIFYILSVLWGSLSQYFNIISLMEDLSHNISISSVLWRISLTIFQYHQSYEDLSHNISILSVLLESLSQYFNIISPHERSLSLDWEACVALSSSSKHNCSYWDWLLSDERWRGWKILILCQIFYDSSSLEPSGSNCPNYSQFNWQILTKGNQIINNLCPARL